MLLGVFSIISACYYLTSSVLHMAVTGNDVNHGAEYGLEVPCINRFYRP